MIDRYIIFSYFEILSTFLTTNSSMILPAIAASSVLMLIIGKLFYMIRTKFPAKVNCWFCNSNTSVPYNSTNSWYCPSCDQYNGFCADGSYNRILPEQFNEKLNMGSWCSKVKQKITNINGFCRFCSINLELKIQQLAQFVPLNKENYDEEVQQFSDQLERVYRLCSRCQGILEKTLHKKQELYVASQYRSFKAPVNHKNTQNGKQRHSVYFGLIASLSLALFISAVPHYWLDQLFTNYPLPDWIHDLSKHVPSHIVPFLGVAVQLIDCICMRDTASFINLSIWLILLCLPYVPVKNGSIDSAVQIVASILFFITSLTEGRNHKPKSVAAVKPVQFQKLEDKIPAQVTKSQGTESVKPFSSKSAVSDPIIRPSPTSSPTHESTPEDFGLSKLNVSSRRVTRSQTKPFQAKQYGHGSASHDIFRTKTVNLSPPKLQFDKASEYQLPLTRSSSQSSGFVSMSHHKDFEEDRSPSIVQDIDSISQCSVSPLTPYHSPISSPVPFTNPFGGPFSQFQPYAIVHFTQQSFDKFYPYPSLSVASMNLSSSSLSSQKSFVEQGWFYHLKNALSSLMFMFLITSNVAIMWKMFGEGYFKSIT